jgi:RNAse (barnase) inhibitor barstar
MKQRYEIDGAAFKDLDGFYDEFSRKVILGAKWGRNLDAFDDALSGGFGTPPGGFTLAWRNSALSRTRLGHSEYAKLVEQRLQKYKSERSLADLAAARAGSGPTVYDLLLEIIRGHEDVELVLD